MGDIEGTIERLRQKGISLADIYGKLGMERGYFDGRRRSVNEYKRKELARQIIEAYPDYFLDEVQESEPEKTSGNEYKEKYIRLLEERLKDVEADREFLRKIVFEKLDILLKEKK